MTIPINWQEIIARVSPEILADFYHPLIPPTPMLFDKVPQGAPETAWLDFRTNKRYICRSFLEDLINDGEIDPETAVKGIEKHEIGHYMVYPREAAVLLYLGHLGEHQFKKHAKHVLAYWNDIMNNLPQIVQHEKGKEVRAVYRAMNTKTEKQGVLSKIQKALLKANNIDVAEVEKIHRTYSVNRLLTAYYQKQSEEQLGVDLSDSPFLEQKLEELLKINYLKTDANEIANYMLFGTVIADVLKKLEEALPENLKKLQQIMSGLMMPIIADAPEVKDFSDKQIEGALDKIIRKWGKKRYEMIKKYVEEETGKSYDPPVKPKTDSHAGLEHSEITFHDDQISYYVRKARTYGLYIHRKPIVTDVTNNYPEGLQVFRVGNSVRRLNMFSTGGRVLPGITQRYREKTGTKKDKLYRTPDAWVWIDTSCSMKSPEKDSDAVLGAFIIADNYWANGSSVGVANWSTDTAFLLPTRNLHDVHSMLTAYWGGGTYANIPKFKEYIERMGRQGRDLRPFYMTEHDYQELFERMTGEERKEVEDKHISIRLEKEIQDRYGKMDNFLITDGGIVNIGELVDYMNSIAVYARNTIFMIGNRRLAKQWQALELRNTHVVSVETSQDLAGIVVGDVRRMVPEQSRPASLFYR